MPARNEPDRGELHYPFLFDTIDAPGLHGLGGLRIHPGGGTSTQAWLAGLGLRNGPSTWPEATLNKSLAHRTLRRRSAALPNPRDSYAVVCACIHPKSGGAPPGLMIRDLPEPFARCKVSMRGRINSSALP